MMKPLRIVMMGTPAFATAVLDALLKSPHEIVGVVTAPDKPAGRGLQLSESDVKKFAVAHQLPVLQPVKLRDPAFLQQIQSLQADLFVVVAFRMLPQQVWSMAPKGCINLHASLLPQYRGAAPINHAIINGEKETGLTTFFIEQEIDTGKIIFSQKVTIGENETAGELHDRLKEMGAQLVLKTVDAIASGSYPQVEQVLPAVVHSAPKIFKDDCRIEWKQNMQRVFNFIRGLSPHPAAFTTLQGKTLKILKAEKEPLPSLQPAGSFDTDGKTFLRFYCIDGALRITDLQLEGKRRMKVDEFLRGTRL